MRRKRRTTKRDEERGREGRERETERETRADRRRRRPSCAADCTTKGAIMRPSSNHRAFCPPFDPSTPLDAPGTPLHPEISTGYIGSTLRSTTDISPVGPPPLFI